MPSLSTNTIFRARQATGAVAPAPARRSGADRRRRRLPPLRYWFYGQRRRARRRGDQGYVDVYDPGVVGICLATLMLSCLDAYLTLRLIAEGAREVNPIMDYLLRRDLTLFVDVKIAFTAFGLLVLILHKNFRVAGPVRVLHLKYVLFACYALLVGYELILLAH